MFLFIIICNQQPGHLQEHLHMLTAYTNHNPLHNKFPQSYAQFFTKSSTKPRTTHKIKQITKQHQNPSTLTNWQHLNPSPIAPKPTVIHLERLTRSTPKSPTKSKRKRESISVIFKWLGQMGLKQKKKTKYFKLGERGRELKERN